MLFWFSSFSSLFSNRNLHLSTSQYTQGFQLLTTKQLHQSSWRLITFFQGDPGSSWEEIFPDKPEIRSDNLTPTKSISLTFRLNSSARRFSLFLSLSLSEDLSWSQTGSWLLLPQTTSFVGDRGLFVCKCITLGEDLDSGVPSDTTVQDSQRETGQG